MTSYQIPAQDPAARAASQYTRRILMVDDEPGIRSFIGQALTAAGYDLIMLDLVTPDGDGVEALDRILRARPAQAVIVVYGGAIKSGEVAGAGERIKAGCLTLDVAHVAADIGDGPVPLTRLEFMLLRVLAEHAGQPVPKGTLLARVWGCDFDPRSNIVDVCVRRLRCKLGFDLIKTVRGEGYQLAGRLPAV